MFSIPDEIHNMEVVSTELTNLRFTFHKCVTKAGADLVKLKHVNKIIKDLVADFRNDGGKFRKKAWRI